MLKCYWCFTPIDGGLFQWAETRGQAKAKFAIETGRDFIDVRTKRESVFDGCPREISDDEANRAGYWLEEW